MRRALIGVLSFEPGMVTINVQIFEGVEGSGDFGGIVIHLTVVVVGEFGEENPGGELGHPIHELLRTVSRSFLRNARVPPSRQYHKQTLRRLHQRLQRPTGSPASEHNYLPPLSSKIVSLDNKNPVQTVWATIEHR